jgi:hypothetical protein
MKHKIKNQKLDDDEYLAFLQEITVLKEMMELERRLKIANEQIAELKARIVTLESRYNWD